MVVYPSFTTLITFFMLPLVKVWHTELKHNFRDLVRTDFGELIIVVDQYNMLHYFGPLIHF